MPSAVAVVFWVLSLLAVGSALLVVTTRHLGGQSAQHSVSSSGTLPLV